MTFMGRWRRLEIVKVVKPIIHIIQNVYTKDKRVWNMRIIISLLYIFLYVPGFSTIQHIIFIFRKDELGNKGKNFNYIRN